MASKLGRFFTSMIIEQSAPRLGFSSELSTISMSRLVHSSTQKDAAAPPQNKEDDQAAPETTEAKQDAGDEEEAEDYGVNKETGEIGGPRGPEPTRYGDWEQKGRCSDF